MQATDTLGTHVQEACAEGRSRATRRLATSVVWGRELEHAGIAKACPALAVNPREEKHTGQPNQAMHHTWMQAYFNAQAQDSATGSFAFVSSNPVRCRRKFLGCYG